MSKNRPMFASCSSAATLVAAGELGQPAGVAKERVEHLARGPALREVAVAAQVGGQPGERGAARRARGASRPGCVLELLEHLEHAAVPPPRRARHLGEVAGRDPEALRGGEGVDVDARRRVGDRAQQREQEPDLRPRVQARRAREAPRQPGGVERSEDRRRRRSSPERAPRGRAAARRHRPAAGSLRRSSPPPRPPSGTRGAGSARPPGPTRSAMSRFEMPTFTSSRSGSLNRDEAVGAVEDRRERAVVPAQDDRAGAAVPVPELEDVADRGAPEAVDRLVVVADDRHVAMPLREQRHELRLRPVRVLELVDEDVPVARLERLARRGRLAQELERQRDLVAEVDRAVLAQQRRCTGRNARASSPCRRASSAAAAAASRSASSTVGAVGDRRLELGRAHREAGPRARGTPRARRPRRGSARTACASAPRNRVGSPSGRYSARSRSNSRSRRKTTTSGRDSTRTSGASPSSNANSRISRSPKAWNVEIAVSA